MSMTMRVIIGVAAVLFIVWRLAERWKGASDYSDAMAAELREQTEDFQTLRGHPGLATVWQYTSSRYGVTFDQPPPGYYQIKFLSLYNEKGLRVRPYDPSGRYLNVYLKRDQAPKYIALAVDMATGVVTEQQVSWFSWDAMLPSEFS